MKNKLIPQKKIGAVAKRCKNENNTVVFTNGCFDIIHPGHIKILKKAKEAGNIVIVGLNSDRSIRKIKGPSRPILNQQARIEILSRIDLIDYIVLFNTPTPENLIKKIQPDILLKGSDWKGKKIIGQDFVKSHGGKVLMVNVKKGFSTTNIINKIKKAYG